MTSNVDAVEIAKFDALAASWWDRDGQSKPLHEINPLRLGYIQQRCTLEGQRVIDIGCGGGVLSEALAQNGALVTAIDMGEAALNVAKLHALEADLTIDYQLATAEEMAEKHPAQFDVVTCLEMLEHVPNPDAIIAACSRLVKPGGHLFFSTLNRQPKAYLLAVVGAEYILNMLPKGTHDYKKFIKPAELAASCRQAGLSVSNITGLSYNPLFKQYKLGTDVAVNYLMHCQKNAE